MNFNIYMLDDDPLKVESLDAFRLWLSSVFGEAAHSFSSGFADPLAASQSADDIETALRDPLGIILLDVLMDYPRNRGAALELQKRFDVEHASEGVSKEHFYDRMGGTIRGTELCATVVAIARQMRCRVVWCSTQAVAKNLNNQLPTDIPRIEWPDNKTYINQHTWGPPTVQNMKRAIIAFHPDPKINRGICLALRPDPGPWGTPPVLRREWNHTWLEASGAPHNAQMCDFLGLEDCDGEAAKALLCPNRTGPKWGVRVARDAYELRRAELLGACTQLGVPLPHAPDKCRLPVQPGFPFLVALADLHWQMSQCKKTFPPYAMTLVRDGGSHCLRMELRKLRRDGVPISMDAFETVYRKVSSRMATGRHETSIRLCNLRCGRVEGIEDVVDQERGMMFGGTGDGSLITIEFDKDPQSPAVLVKWSTDNL